MAEELWNPEWCIVGTLLPYPYSQQGPLADFRSQKIFPAGAKLYIVGGFAGMGHETITVIGYGHRRRNPVLAHIKAHEYGSAYENGIAWGSVWTEVGTALDALRAREVELVQRLTGELDDGDVDDLAHQLDDAEPGEPSRPHPYLPHQGVMGSVARRIVRRTDRAWDHAEGRPGSWPTPAAKKKPGLLGQYLMADPRFDPDRTDETT